MAEFFPRREGGECDTARARLLEAEPELMLRRTDLPLSLMTQANPIRDDRSGIERVVGLGLEYQRRAIGEEVNNTPERHQYLPFGDDPSRPILGG